MKRNFIIVLVLLMSVVSIFTACGKKDADNEKYKIYFNVDGKVVNTVPTDGNELPDIGKNPEKDEYIFDGWFFDKDIWEKEFTSDYLSNNPLTGDVTVYAKWTWIYEDNIYTITFNGNGGTLVSGETIQSVGHGQSAQAPEFIKQGLTLTWDKTFDNIKSDGVINAVWMAKVDFVFGGGTEVESRFVESQSKIDRPNISRLGYTLENWYTSFDGGNSIDDVWLFDENIVVTDTVLYANWVINTYTITFKSMDSMDIVKAVTHGAALGEIPDVPIKIGYTGVWDVTDFKNVTSNLIVNAVYKINTYTITFKSLGSLDIVKTVTYGGTLGNIPNVPEKIGHVGRWDMTDFTNITSNLTVNAIYEKNVYTVIFDIGGGTVISGEKNQSIFYGQAATAPILEKEGHTLSWDNSFNFITDNLTVKAIWTIMTYTVTFKSSISNDIVKTVTHGGTLTAPEVPTKIGYTGRWDIEDFTDIKSNLTVNVIYEKSLYTVIFDIGDGTLVSGETTQSVFYGQAATAPIAEKKGYDLSWNMKFNNITEKLNVKAIWTIKTYAVSFGGNGGTLLSGQPNQTVEYGKPVSAPVYKKDGCEFVGWFNNSNEEWETNTLVTSNLTLYAKWGVNLEVQKIGDGMVFGGGLYIEGASVTATAQSAEGYGFYGWYENGKLKSVDPIYVFDMPSTPFTLTAEFVLGIVTPSAALEGGLGTAESPYIIKTANQLSLLSLLVNKVDHFSLNVYFELGSSIDLGGAEWIPIGDMNASGDNAERIFKGFFDGKGYVISNFKITKDNSADYAFDEFVGLFGVAFKAKIENLGVTDFIFDVKNNNAICGGGLLAIDFGGTISNCYTKGKFNARSSKGFIYLGGLVGECSNNIIIGSYSEIDLSAESFKLSLAGGLAAIVRNSKITNCNSSGTIDTFSLDDGITVGGLIAESQELSIITECYTTINFELFPSTGAIVGGFIGHNSSAHLTKCYATGNISVASASSMLVVGGLVGYFSSGNMSQCYATGNVYASSAMVFVGGLSGYSYFGNMTECYAVGDITAASTNGNPVYAGGLAGVVESAEIVNCFAVGNVEASLRTISPHGVGGLVGSKYEDATIVNCFRFLGQSVIIKDGNTKKGASNEYGDVCVAENLQDLSFYIDTLKWNGEIWDCSILDIENGKLPIFK